MHHSSAKNKASWLLSVALVLGCATRPAPGSDGENVGYPGELLPAASIDREFQWEQRVTAHWQGNTRGFEAVLSQSDDELLLVGLGPMKTPGFFVRLRDGEVSFENHTPEKLPFDPRYMILDVQRVYYPWIPGEPPRTGERHHVAEGEAIHERWHEGVLLERRFTREDGRPAGDIVIRYEGWQEGRDAPRRATLDNGWLGYTLVIDTLVQERL